MQFTRRGSVTIGLGAAGGIIGRDMFAWVTGKVADAIWAGKPQVMTWGAFPWQNAIGACCLVAAVIVAFWPGLMRLSHNNRSKVDALEQRLNALEGVPSYAPYDDTPLTERVAGLESIKRNIINDYQRMLGLESRFGSELNGFKEAAAEESAAIRMNMQVVERKANDGLDLIPKVEAIRVDVAACRADLDRLEESQKDERDRRLGSFAALDNRERLNRLQSSIINYADELYKSLKNGEVYDVEQWEQWESVHSHWESSLREWLDVATWYGLAVIERVMFVDDTKYRDGWTVEDNQFPTAEAVRRFKKFRIIQQQWEEVKPSVQRGLHAVAFSGLTDMEVRNGRPAG